MEPSEYDRLHAYESWYWWYAAQRANLIAAVRELRLPVGARILDAGCGTGRNLIELSREIGAIGHGVDASPLAALHWNGDPGLYRCLGSVNELPYGSASFDLVASVDLLPSRGVIVPRAMGELARVLRPGGYLVLLAPAYDWLRSRHDAAVHCVHRFSRRELRSLAAQAGLTVQRITHRFPLFFPMIAPTRLMGRLRRLDDSVLTRSDLRPIPRWLNAVLLAATRVEHAAVRRLPVPFGSTLLMVARRVPA